MKFNGVYFSKSSEEKGIIKSFERLCTQKAQFMLKSMIKTRISLIVEAENKMKASKPEIQSIN